MSSRSSKYRSSSSAYETEVDVSHDENDLRRLIEVTYPARISALKRLLAEMETEENQQIFDETDIQIVVDDIREQQAQFDKVVNHVRTFINLNETISARQEVFNRVNEETGLFEHRPQLLESFADKQAHLECLKDACRDKVRQEQKPIVSKHLLDLDDEDDKSSDTASVLPSKSSSRPLRGRPAETPKLISATRSHKRSMSRVSRKY